MSSFKVQTLLDYHGLLDHPAGSLVQIADRHHVTSRTVSNNVAAVRGAGRITATLGLPAQAAAPTNRRRWTRYRLGN